jgi:hypothetical protein
MKAYVIAVFGMTTFALLTTRAVVIGHWLLNEGSGTIALDSSGQGNHGTLSGGAAYVNTPGTSGISLDGVDDFGLHTDGDASLIRNNQGFNQ